MSSESHTPSTTTYREVPCPFCGLLCDDLSIEVRGTELAVSEHGCARSRKGFEQPLGSLAPEVGGRPVELDGAVSRAAELLREARLPLYAGLGTDAGGMRAVLDLADRTGGVVDHMHGDTMLHNSLALQDSGWMVTTFSEVRNRADLLILAGTDAVTRNPRFFERHVWTGETLFGANSDAREIVYLGAGLDTEAGRSPDGRAPTVIPVEPTRLREAVMVLCALLLDRQPQQTTVGGVPVTTLAALAQRMQAARYGVIAWAPADLSQGQADLTVHALCELVRHLNRTTRFSGLPLGGDDGATTAAAVCAWQTGYPLRTGFGRGYPEYDPWRNATGHLLAGAADVLLWVSAFDAAATPPPSQVPTIVLGRPGMRFSHPPAVYVPIGTPGVDHAGQLCRADTVVTLPLRKLRDSGLPTAGEVLAAVGRRLRTG
jgi:formylmethanofuran dehydrogenase subunit B